MAYTAEDEELLSLGWPHLALLVDKHRHDKKPEEAAWKVLKAIDPVYGVRWPRETARRYLHALAKGGKARSRRPFEEGLVCTEPVTAEVADRIIRQTVSKIDRHAFHYQQAFFLLEVHLGPDLLGERIVVAMEGFKKRDWTFNNLHLRFTQAIFALECCLLRGDPAAAAGLFARVQDVYTKRPPGQDRSVAGSRLRLTVDGSQGAETSWLGVYNMPFLTDDEALVRKRMEHEYAGWLVDPQHLRLFGPDIVPPRVYAGLRRDPAWKQRADVQTYGVINHLLAVRWMLALLGSRAAKGAPEQWLMAHMTEARSALERLLAQGSPHAAIIQALLAGDAKAVKKAKSTKPPSAKELRQAVQRIFDDLVAALETGRGRQEAEEQAITTATHTLVELKASTGDPLPEAHVGHALGVDGWDNLDPPLQRLSPTPVEMARWFKLIDAASLS